MPGILLYPFLAENGIHMTIGREALDAEFTSSEQLVKFRQGDILRILRERINFHKTTLQNALVLLNQPFRALKTTELASGSKDQKP